MKKTNLLFYNGKLRTLGAIWRGVWNVEGADIPKVVYWLGQLKCVIGNHHYIESVSNYYGGSEIYCSRCGKQY